MDVVDSLAAIRSRINDSAISLRKALGASDFRCGPLQVPEELLLLLLCVSDRCDVFSWDDKNVHGRLRLDVGEGVAVLILVYGFRRDASIDDLAEDAVHDDESTSV